MGLSLYGDPQSTAQALGNPYTPVVSGGITLGGKHMLGTRAVGPNGRAFRYALSGGSALVAGNMLQSPAQITAHQNMAPTANVAIGDTTLTVTLGAVLASANQYAEGWIVISGGPGIGMMYAVSSHPAAALSATLQITLKEPIAVALTSAASKVDLLANPYSGVIQSPITTLTGVPVGVATFATPANSYDWVQTEGPAGVLIAGTPAVGAAVVVPGTAAGAVVVDGATAPTKVVGVMLATGVDGRVQSVLLSL